tara:strand:- start:20915 stop:21175 length:261 start_codon:yes stop_codon:yes gene_type:complete
MNLYLQNMELHKKPKGDKSMKVTSIRYFETSRGVGYEAKTKEGSIWNDGDGGPTYFRGNTPETHREFCRVDEFELEAFIDTFENVK